MGGEGEKSGLLNVGWLVVVDLPLLHRPVPYQLQLAHQATRATRASTRAPPLVLDQATFAALASRTTSTSSTMKMSSCFTS